FICALIINISILFFTLTSPFSNFTYGAYASYLTLTFLFLLNLRNVELLMISRVVFKIINILIIVSSVLSLLENEIVRGILVDYYSSGYPLLVERMLLAGKPVLTFGTHSLAGVFFYLFYYINLKEYENTKDKVNLLILISYIILLFFLKSTTSTLLLIIATIQFFTTIFKYKKISVFSLPLILILVLFWDNIGFVGQFTVIFGKEGNGFVGRYSGEGVLVNNINYIMNNPFRGIGLGHDDSLYYTDSGIILNLLRGSIFLALSIYIGLFFLFSKNLLNKKTAFYLVLIILAFEIGYSLLTYKRMIAFIPFLIVYLNTLESYRIKSFKKKEI
ncbi:hypothetical protein V7200_23695, partial [Cytobacillus firmus]|uniref:hypothetical protein n=2 Tax=Cytobacillus firmus TaxID=1399 RepID=UPI002FFEF0DA